MQKKLTLLLLLLTSFYANAMHIVARAAVACQKLKTGAPARNVMHTLAKTFVTQRGWQNGTPARYISGVTIYQPHHEKDVKKIALDNMYHLTTWYVATRKHEHEVG